MSSMARSLASYVDPKRQYRPDVTFTRSSTPPVPLLPTNPFYDVDDNWDCFANTSTHGESSVSSSSSMERYYYRDPYLIRLIEENKNECFNIVKRIKRLNNCLKRKRIIVKKMLKVAEKSCEVDFGYIESVKESLRRNEKIQLMFRHYSFDKWKPYQGKRPQRGYGKRRHR